MYFYFYFGAGFFKFIFVVVLLSGGMYVCTVLCKNDRPLDKLDVQGDAVVLLCVVNYLKIIKMWLARCTLDNI